jgi:hypothetical protein
MAGVRTEELRARPRELPPAGASGPSHGFLGWAANHEDLVERKPLPPAQMAEAEIAWCGHCVSRPGSS